MTLRSAPQLFQKKTLIIFSAALCRHYKYPIQNLYHLKCPPGGDMTGQAKQVLTGPGCTPRTSARQKKGRLHMGTNLYVIHLHIQILSKNNRKIFKSEQLAKVTLHIQSQNPKQTKKETSITTDSGKGTKISFTFQLYDKLLCTNNAT